MAFDLDKVIAEEEEREPFTFTFDGDEYELPAGMDVRAVAAISGGRLDEGLRLLLNPDQWQRIQDSPKVLTATALGALFDEYAAYTGVDSLGESSASTGSANRKARRSRPTSKGSTTSGSRRLAAASHGDD